MNDTADATPLLTRHAALVTAARLNLNNGFGISQAQLAKSAGTSQQTISRIEKGTQGVTDSLKQRISRALGMKVADLFPLDAEGESHDVEADR